MTTTQKQTSPSIFNAITVFIASLIYLARTAWDIYHMLVVGIALIIVVIVVNAVSRVQASNLKAAEERRKERTGGASARRSRTYQTPVGFLIMLALAYGILQYIVAYGIGYGGSNIPSVYNLFYDTGYDAFVESVETVAGADAQHVRDAIHPEQAADMIKVQIETVPGMGPEQIKALAQWRYDLLYKAGSLKPTDDEKKVVWNEAVAWGNSYGIDTSLLQALINKTVPPPTPMPTLPAIVVTSVMTATPSSIVIQDGQMAFKAVHQDGLVLSCTIQVKDSNGQFVPNLGRYDIRVSVMTPNGQVFVDPQMVGVIPLKDLQLPIFNHLFIDISKSMLEIKNEGDPVAFEAARMAMLGYVRTARPIDRFMITQFGHDVTSSDWLTPDQAIDLINNLEATGESTHLYDALATITATDGPQVVIVLSDGADQGSRATVDQAVQAMLQSGAQIYGVAIKSGRYDGSGVANLVEQAHGITYTTESAAQLEDAFLDLASQNQSLYRVQVLLPTEVITSVTLNVGTNIIGPYLIYK